MSEREVSLGAEVRLGAELSVELVIPGVRGGGIPASGASVGTVDAGVPSEVGLGEVGMKEVVVVSGVGFGIVLGSVFEVGS